MYDIAVIIRITEEIETKRKLCRKIPEGTKRITSMLDERTYLYYKLTFPFPSIVKSNKFNLYPYDILYSGKLYDLPPDKGVGATE